MAALLCLFPAVHLTREFAAGHGRPQKRKRPRAKRGQSSRKRNQALLDFAFFILNVLANNWVVFVDDHLFSHCPCVLFGHIKVASACGRVQADFDRGWLRHWASPAAESRKQNADP